MRYAMPSSMAVLVAGYGSMQGINMAAACLTLLFSRQPKPR